jgi:DNA-binding response OmpR family regulator
MAKILIVDDDPDVVEASSLFLKREGYEVDYAYDRASGMLKIDGYKPDLLILDVMMEMPDDGIAMAQDLRRNGFSAPILMLTSIGKATGLTYGKDNDMVPVDAFEEKPVGSETLVARVKELLRKKEG